MADAGRGGLFRSPGGHSRHAPRAFLASSIDAGAGELH